MDKVKKGKSKHKEDLQDTQNNADSRNIPINRVGIKDIAYPILITDKDKITQNVVGNFVMSVSLPPEKKGTHMSRFVEVIDKQKKAISVENFEDLVKTTAKTLQSDTAFISLDFTYFKNKSAPVTGVKSLLDYKVNFSAESKNNRHNKFITVTVPVTSLCPCSKNISDYGAHNQRSNISATIRLKETIWIDEIIEILENQASCQIYGLLKRPDEKYVTEEAYNNPKFVEDMIRDLAITLNKDDRVLAYKIESENFESIHNHSAYAYIEKDKTKDSYNKNNNVSFLKLSQLRSSCH
ncbi:MAG: GTP cyclohydrolase FolE2 [Pseudomonadota bacterium]|nr:GTP cyclohydrolase FolE2 [Pseudomonadota bacterium]|tara:strand:- start:519 stop:1403 length:885 start_codon:yes stop_codon:yes gene_type:complete